MLFRSTIEKRVRIPLARLLASNQIAEGETVVISKVAGQEEFEYSVESKAVEIEKEILE